VLAVTKQKCRAADGDYWKPHGTIVCVSVCWN